MNIRKKIVTEQRRITALVTARFPQFYLAGGTALSFHYDHRFSEDLDFFSPQYEPDTTEEIMRFIKKETGYAFTKEGEVPPGSRMAGMKVFYIDLGAGSNMKIDFVEDVLRNTCPVKKGLLSPQDIYIRKIYAAIGTGGKVSDTGRQVAAGRQSVKDLYDLYWLSLKFRRLSEFFFEFFSGREIARLEQWYRAFDRQEAALELIDLDIKHDPKRVFRYMDDMVLDEMQSKDARLK